MVLLKTTLVGIALLAVGVILLTVAGQYVTIEVQQVHSHDVEAHTEFLVGDQVDRQYALPGGVGTFGVITVTQAPSNQSGDVRFIVLDADNYAKWSAGSQANFLYTAEKQGEFNYTFTTSNSGIYHFVFDNRQSLYKKYVILTVAYNEITTTRAPDPRTAYVAWPLVVAGALVLLYGVARKPPVTWT
jgi:hypothetical protein